MGQIYINLKGRDPFGIVEPGEEYQRLRDELAAGLYKIINPLWGQPYVKKVYMREEIYSGENLDSLPDIVFEPYDLSCVDSGDFEFFSNKLFDGSVGISGAHRSNGMIIMWGNKVVVHNANQQSALVKMVDLAPTILYLLGEPIPDGMDGRVISEAISNEYLQVQPPQRSKDDSTIAPNDSLDGFTQQEEEELISRLTDLGYLS
jgi:predicted AlkP superfamily phosphohydrolase/phosphomutase